MLFYLLFRVGKSILCESERALILIRWLIKFNLGYLFIRWIYNRLRSLSDWRSVFDFLRLIDPNGATLLLLNSISTQIFHWSFYHFNFLRQFLISGNLRLLLRCNSAQTFSNERNLLCGSTLIVFRIILLLLSYTANLSWGRNIRLSFRGCLDMVI